MLPQGLDGETAMSSVGLFPEADLEVLPCETLLIVLSVLGILAAVLVEFLNWGWFIASAPCCPDRQTAPLATVVPKHSAVQPNISEEPPVTNSELRKEGLVTASEVRAVVKNTFLHFEEETMDDKPSSPLSRSMPIGVFNHTLKAELLQRKLPPRSPCRLQPPAVAAIIEEERITSSLQHPPQSAPLALQPCSRPRKRRIPRSARKKRLNGRTGPEWEPCVEPEALGPLPRTPIVGECTPRTSTSSATTLCLEVLVPEDAPRFIELPSKKVQARNRPHLSLMHELSHNFESHDCHVIDPLWGQFLD